MKIRTLAAFGLFLSATAAIAQDAPAQPERDTAWFNAQMAALATLRPEDGWQVTASGLRYRRVSGGAAGAPRPAPTDTVTIHYAGKL